MSENEKNISKDTARIEKWELINKLGIVVTKAFLELANQMRDEQDRTMVLEAGVNIEQNFRDIQREL